LQIKKTNKILLIDDDKSVLNSFSNVLKLKGYSIDTAQSGAEAREKAKNKNFDLFLIDINLPDIQGTELLIQLQKISPEAINIMVTGNPTVENAIKSINTGATSFFSKPFDIDNFLKTIKLKLEEKERKQMSSQNKVEEWVKFRISKIQLSEYNKFADEISALFRIFGLSKTQAKIYTALNALGVATASEIATLSKVRREEVYRIIPDLENRGIVNTKLEAPRKFAATEPKTALKILAKIKIDLMESEIDNINTATEELASRLENTSFGICEENSVEALSRQDNVENRLAQMFRKANNFVLSVASPLDMEKILHDTLTNEFKNQINIRWIISSDEIEDETDELDALGFLKSYKSVATKENFTFDLRHIGKRPFNLLLVDGKEGIWGEPKSAKTERKVFWTNDPVQLGILRRAFENVWQEAEIIMSES
jgi:sugar-specific transcriptional regulator TrmB/FixJ family two-component response regulator